MGGSSVRVGPWVAEWDERKAMRAASQDEKKSTWEAAAFFLAEWCRRDEEKIDVG
jgi:hypothetical protein